VAFDKDLLQKIGGAGEGWSRYAYRTPAGDNPLADGYFDALDGRLSPGDVVDLVTDSGFSSLLVSSAALTQGVSVSGNSGIVLAAGAGLVGDGSGSTDGTDDLANLQATIDAVADSGGGIIYVQPPAGDFYKITDTLIIKSGVWLVLHQNTEIRCTTNNHAVQVKDGARLSGGKIRVFADSSTAACIYLFADAAERFLYESNTIIEDVLCYQRGTGTSPNGIGVLCEADHDGSTVGNAAVGWVTFRNVRAFSVGIGFDFVCVEDSGDPGEAWINANTFYSCKVSGFRIGVRMRTSGTGAPAIEANHFNELDMQSSDAVEYCIDIEDVDRNRFIGGTLWDIQDDTGIVPIRSVNSNAEFNPNEFDLTISGPLTMLPACEVASGDLLRLNGLEQKKWTQYNIAVDASQDGIWDHTTATVTVYTAVQPIRSAVTDGNVNIDNIETSNAFPGQMVTFYGSSSGETVTFTNSGNIEISTAGNFVCDIRDTITFVYTGFGWNEVCRSNN
jgi:hypothetical protein